MFRIAKEFILVGLSLAAIALAVQAHAGPVAMMRPLKNAAVSAFLPQGNQTLAPYAHVRFCIASPAECADGAGNSTVEMTMSKLSFLNSVNRRVNSAIEPFMPDGPETWLVNPERGNCHDYAVTKRHELIRAGWPSASLRLAVAYTRFGVGHLVVVVRTTEGDLVLDNLTDKIVPWNKSGLRFVSVEASDKPRVWYAIR